MPALKVTSGGETKVIDFDNMMLSELEVLEEHGGLDLESLNHVASLQKVRVVGTFLWLLRLREIAAAEHVPLSKAALMCPREGFDVPVTGLTIELVEAPKDQKAPTTTTRSPRTRSSAPRARSAKSGSARSDGSPKS